MGVGGVGTLLLVILWAPGAYGGRGRAGGGGGKTLNRFFKVAEKWAGRHGDCAEWPI